MYAMMDAALWLVSFAQKHLMLPRWKTASAITVEMPPIDAATGKVERTHPPW